MSSGSVLSGLDEPIDALRAVGQMFWQRGWSVGTSSNYSVVLHREPLELLVTASKVRRMLEDVLDAGAPAAT